MSAEPVPTRWAPARRRLAVNAVLAAFVTAASGAALGGGANHIVAAVACVASAVAALFVPALITAQVLTFQMMAAGLILGPARVAPAWGLLLLAGTIVTAELLAAVARLDAPSVRPGQGELRRAGTAAAIGAGVFGVVVLAGLVPAPSGLLSIGLAAAACVALAILLVTRRAHGFPDGG